MADEEVKTYTGHCLCREVNFIARGLSDIWYCHCTQCQHMTGHCVAAAGARRADFSYEGNVRWSPVSAGTRSGHCASCSSYLFWDQIDRATISILAGNLDDTAGLVLKGHIFVAEKKDYFEISDGLPQYEKWPPEGTRQEG